MCYIFLYRFVSSSFSLPSSSVSVIVNSVPLMVNIRDLVEEDEVLELERIKLFPCIE